MSNYVPPRSDLARLAFLKYALTTGYQDVQAGRQYISEALLHRLTEFIPLFESQSQEISQYRSNRSKEVRESSEAFRNLVTYVRDMRNVLKRRVHRLNQPSSVLTYYGIPLSGKLSNPTKPRMWFSLAMKLINGDKQAVEAGYQPMVNPSAQELKEVLDRAQQEYSEIAIADRRYDMMQEELAKLRPQANELIREVMAELRFHLRHMDRPSQRRIMRSYGAVFKNTREELDDGSTGKEEET